MIENIKEKEEEIKKIWLGRRDKESTKNIFISLEKYFNPEKIGAGSPDWAFFIRWIYKWKKELGEAKPKSVRQEEEFKKEMEGLSDQDIEETQNQNRKRTILLLKKALDDYSKHPKRMKGMEVKTLIDFYRTIQAMEESKKRTEIAKGKLKLGAVRTLLPYLRMKPEELESLKEKINDSFERIKQLREAGDSGEGIVGTG